MTELESRTEADWELSGSDSEGNEISLVVGAARLMEISPGLTIGRHAQLCDFTIPDETISRRHFRLVRTADGIMIEDLNSLNGTYVDGWRLEPFQVVPVRDGMAITAGHVQLTISQRIQQ